jgi:hypothetical protein
MKPWYLLPAATLVLAFAMAGTDSAAQDKGDPEPKKIALTPGKNSLKGKVTFEGDLPDIAKLNAELLGKMKRDSLEDLPHCQAAEAGDDREQQVWRINKANQGVANVVVFLVAESGTFFACGPDDAAVTAVKDKDLELRQLYCAFKPHVAVLFPEYRDKDNKRQKTGQKLVLLNDSNKAKGGKPGGISHNFKWGDKNVIIPPGESKDVINLVPSKKPVMFQSTIHPWASAHIWVLDHPYFALTDANGEYEIKNAPAGNVRLVAWHEGAPGVFLTIGGAKGDPIKLKVGVTVKNFAI